MSKRRKPRGKKTEAGKPLQGPSKPNPEPREPRSRGVGPQARRTPSQSETDSPASRTDAALRPRTCRAVNAIDELMVAVGARERALVHIERLEAAVTASGEVVAAGSVGYLPLDTPHVEAEIQRRWGGGLFVVSGPNSQGKRKRVEVRIGGLPLAQEKRPREETDSGELAERPPAPRAPRRTRQPRGLARRDEPWPFPPPLVLQPPQPHAAPWPLPLPMAPPPAPLPTLPWPPSPTPQLPLPWGGPFPAPTPDQWVPTWPPRAPGPHGHQGPERGGPPRW